MKKILSALAALFVFLAFLPHDVAEAKSYDVTKYDMIIEVKSNGDAEVKEKITYDFSGDFNGVYRNIDLDGTDGCKDVKVYVEEVGTLREFSPGWGKNPNEYERSQDGNIMSLKVYEKTSSREKTFVYEYTLKNVAKKYNDIGVFNRKVIDRNWDVPLKDISIEIRIPEGATKDELKVFAHGPLEGYSEIINERTSSFYVGEVMPGTFVETLIIFPPNLIPDSQRVFSHDELPAILENEQRLADEANRIREEARARMAQEERLKNIRKKLFPVFLTVIFGAVASFISMNLKYGRDLKPEFDGDYYRDLPGDYTPPVMTYLLTKNVGPNDVMATIMDLVRKKRLKITKIDSEQSGGLFSRNKTVEKYMLEKVKDANLEGLTRHEVFLMEWFVDKLGEGKGLILDDLKEKVKGKNAALEFQRNYETFKELVKMEGSTKDFFTGNDLTGSAMFLLIDLGLILGGIASIKFLHAWVFGISAVILAFFSLMNLLLLKFKTKRTRYGVEQTAMWKAFKRFLLHFSNLDKAEIPSIIIWEHYLVYAISLGVAKEVLALLPKVFSDAELTDPSLTYMGGYNYYSFHHMNSTLTSTMSTVTQAINTASVAGSKISSGSGGGGGFSGGSSGGSGGGGGGGAF